MIASGITEDVLESAARAVGVRVELAPLSGSGKRWRVKLYPVVRPDAYTPGGRRRRGPAGDGLYQRVSTSAFSDGSRRVHAVCWHGFRDYFRACFSAEPCAVFRTALDTWRGLADFEARFRASGGRNGGSQVRPVANAAACRCAESGELDRGEPAPILEPHPSALALWQRLAAAPAGPVRPSIAEHSRAAAYVPEFARPLATVTHAGERGAFRCGASLGDASEGGRVTCRVCLALGVK